MGARGPIPKRAIERRRRNVASDVDTVEVVGEVEMPPVPRGLHPIARRMYASLQESGESAFYEPSDWEAARLAAEVTTSMLWLPPRRNRATGKRLPRRPRGRISSELLAAVWKMWTDLLITEAARRRARIEISRVVSAGERGVDNLAAYRNLGAVETDDPVDEAPDAGGA